jgi:hypothetical protein
MAAIAEVLFSFFFAMLGSQILGVLAESPERVFASAYVDTEALLIIALFVLAAAMAILVILFERLRILFAWLLVFFVAFLAFVAAFMLLGSWGYLFLLFAFVLGKNPATDKRLACPGLFTERVGHTGIPQMSRSCSGDDGRRREN